MYSGAWKHVASVKLRFMKRLFLMSISICLLIILQSSYAGAIIGGPGSVAFIDAHTGLHTAGGWGYWHGSGGIRFYEIIISKEPPVNNRMVPIAAVSVAPYKDAFVIRGLPAGTYYCVVWANGLGHGWSTGAHHFVSKEMPK